MRTQTTQTSAGNTTAAQNITATNPYTARLAERGMTKFLRVQYKQRERGFADRIAGKDIMAYYDAPSPKTTWSQTRPLKIATEVGRANYNMGWRLAKDKEVA